MKKYLLPLVCFLNLTTVIHGMSVNNYKYLAEQLGDKSVTWVEMKDLERDPGMILVTEAGDNFITIVAGYRNKQHALVAIIKNDFQSILTKPIEEVVESNVKIIEDFFEQKNINNDSLYALITNVYSPCDLSDSDSGKVRAFDSNYYKSLYLRKIETVSNSRGGIEFTEYDLLVRVMAGKIIEDPRYFKSYKGK